MKYKKIPEIEDCSCTGCTFDRGDYCSRPVEISCRFGDPVIYIEDKEDEKDSDE